MNRLRFFLLGLLFSPLLLASEPGDTLPVFELDDQHGETRQLDDTIARIYASADRSGDKWLKAAISDQAQLDAQRAIVVADISSAPGFVRRIIRSSLKDRPYLTWLDQRGKSHQWLPYRDERIMLIELDARRITALRPLNSAEALRAALAEPVHAPTANGDPDQQQAGDNSTPDASPTPAP